MEHEVVAMIHCIAAIPLLVSAAAVGRTPTVTMVPAPVGSGAFDVQPQAGQTPVAGSDRASRFERRDAGALGSRVVLGALRDVRGTATLSARGAVPFKLVNNAVYHRTTSAGSFWMGEVENTGTETFAFVEVRLRFFTAQGIQFSSTFTFVFGSCLTLVGSGSETDTCLRPGEVGFFGTYRDFSPVIVDHLECEFDWSDSQLRDPKATIVLTDSRAEAGYNGAVSLAGTLENQGTAPARFVEVAFALKDGSGALLDVDFTFVDGVELGGTDTGLYPFHSGPFLANTDAPFTHFVGFTHKTSWDDYPEAVVLKKLRRRLPGAAVPQP
jgi:hypothetical protein